MKKNIKIIINVLIFVVLSISFSSCSNKEIISDRIIKIGLVPNVTSVPIMYGYEYKIFEDSKLNIELLYFKDEEDMVTMFENDGLDIIISDMVYATKMINSQKEIYISSFENMNYSLVIPNEASGNSLKNGMFTTKLGFYEEFILDTLLNKHEKGISSKITKLPIATEQENYDMIKSRVVNGTILDQSFLSNISEFDLISAEDTKNNNINGDILIFNKKFADKYVSEINTFIKVYNKTVNKITDSIYIRQMSKINEIKGYNLEDNSKDKKVSYKFSKLQKADKKTFEKVLKWAKNKEIIQNDDIKFESIALPNIR